MIFLLCIDYSQESEGEGRTRPGIEAFSLELAPCVRALLEQKGAPDNSQRGLGLHRAAFGPYTGVSGLAWREIPVLAICILP